MIAESRLIGHNFLLNLLVVMTTMVELTSAWHSMKANVKLASSPGPSLLWPWSWCDSHTIMCACTVWRFSMHVVSSIKSLNVCVNDFHDLRIDGLAQIITGMQSTVVRIDELSQSTGWSMLAYICLRTATSFPLAFLHGSIFNHCHTSYGLTHGTYPWVSPDVYIHIHSCG